MSETQQFIAAAPGWAALRRDGKLATERVSAIVFIAAIAGAETIGALASPVGGAALDGLVLLVLINASLLGLVRPASLLPPILALVPMLRILSVALPLKQLPQLAWYPLVGGPLLLGIAIAAGTVGIERPARRSRWWSVPVQLGIALTGVPLGAAAYAILRPQAVASLTWHGITVAAFVLFVFAALAEELLFRRLLQNVVLRLFGPAGLLLSSALYASTYAGSLSLPFAALMGGVGLAFALVVRRSGVLWGVVLAHTLMNLGLLVVWPAVGV